MPSSRTSTARPSGPTSRRSSQRARPTRAAPDPALVSRFAADLDRLANGDEKLGIAVSGGPDSLALLLLAQAARPGRIEAATVDHRLRAGAAEEAEIVAGLCKQLGIPHAILRAEWEAVPQSALQERARTERYRLLARWLGDRGCSALVTGHHADDQAETFVMRLNRGAGVRGLAAMRPAATIPGAGAPLLRPLLGWSRDELARVCAAAGVEPLADPSNEDGRFERVRVRRGLAAADWVDGTGVAASAAHLADAEEALSWAAAQDWKASVTQLNGEIGYRPLAPAEIRRRIVARAIEELATEGPGQPLRGRELDRVLETLAAGETATLRGVACSGGRLWLFVPAPSRSR